MAGDAAWRRSRRGRYGSRLWKSTPWVGGIAARGLGTFALSGKRSEGWVSDAWRGDDVVVCKKEGERRLAGWLIVRRELCTPSMPLCGESNWTPEALKEAALRQRATMI